VRTSRASHASDCRLGTGSWLAPLLSRDISPGLAFPSPLRNNTTDGPRDRRRPEYLGEAFLIFDHFRHTRASIAARYLVYTARARIAWFSALRQLSSRAKRLGRYLAQVCQWIASGIAGGLFLIAFGFWCLARWFGGLGR
jgi:hypothetical protein